MTSKLTASPEVVQTCRELLDSEFIHYFFRGFGTGMLLAIAIGGCFIVPFVADAIDIYAPKRYRDFLRTRREMRLDRKIAQLKKLQESSEAKS